MITFSKLTAERYGDGWHKKGFFKALKVALLKYERDEELHDAIVERVGKFVPDLWRMYFKQTTGELEPGVSHNKILYFEMLEIEDTNPLSIEKLQKIIDLWWLIDSTESLELNLFVCDRYGFNIRQLPLVNYAFALEKASIVEDEIRAGHTLVKEGWQ